MYNGFEWFTAEYPTFPLYFLGECVCLRFLSTFALDLGWQNEDCRYGPERGVGVGDDTNSCAFDGARCKVWNGPPSEQRNNDYGREWSNGDVLSCLFSWNGEVSFWLNGVDMGVAFRELNPLVNWYPAASIAMDQHCCFNFGGKPFRCVKVLTFSFSFYFLFRLTHLVGYQTLEG